MTAKHEPVYFYIIETYSRPRLVFVSSEWREFGGQDFEVRRCTESAIVKDITDGQIEDVQKVLEVCDELGTCSDVTEDVALAVRQKLYDEFEPVPGYLESFLSIVDGVVAPQPQKVRSPVVADQSTPQELVP